MDEQRNKLVHIDLELMQTTQLGKRDNTHLYLQGHQK